MCVVHSPGFSCPLSRWGADPYLTGLSCGYIMRHSLGERLCTEQVLSTDGAEATEQSEEQREDRIGAQAPPRPELAPRPVLAASPTSAFTKGQAAGITGAHLIQDVGIPPCSPMDKPLLGVFRAQGVSFGLSSSPKARV